MQKRPKLALATILVLVMLIGLCSFIACTFTAHTGYYLVLEPEDFRGATGAEVIERARDDIRTRLDDKGYTDAVISIQDGNKIRVEVPRVDDDGVILEILSQTGELTFRDGNGKVWLNGEDHIKDASVGMDNGGYVVCLDFTPQGQKKFTEATTEIYNNLSDKRLYIYLDDTKISELTVQGVLSQVSVSITGYANDYEQAENIAIIIRIGKFPIKYRIVESRSLK